MERISNVYEVTHRLLGMIEPQGETSIDEVRLQNLEDTIQLTLRLLGDIIQVSQYKNRHEASMKKAGETADNFILEIKEFLNN